MKLDKKDICNLVGTIALLIYIILAISGKTTFLLTGRIILASVAAIAYLIKMGIEFHDKQDTSHSVILTSFCLWDIYLTATEFAG